MREIKFRTWDGKDMFNIFDSTTQENWFLPLWKDKYKVMQYTGLKDKKDKEIYEGDIVEYTDYSGGLYLFKEQPTTIGVVKVKHLGEFLYLKGMGTFEGRKVEVIGNIYENSELIKK